MRINYPVALSMLTALVGCATTTPSDLTASATNATSAATVAQSVDREVFRARVLGLVQGEQPPGRTPDLSTYVCLPSSASVELTAKELGAYADAINAVGKVAAKPTDTSYAGYLQQFKKNQTAIETPAPTPDQASAKDAQETLDAQKRCTALFTEDLDTPLTPPRILPGSASVTAISGAVASLDALVKAILAGAEQIQRDLAVHRATQNMLVTIKDATAKLSEAPGTADYTLQGPSGCPSSRLGNTLAIHRWLAARRVRADWTDVVTVLGRGDQPKAWQIVDRFATDADAYVTLSTVDPDKLLTQLKAAVDKAAETTNKRSVGDILDSLSSIGSAVSGIDNKYSAFRKTL